MGISLECSCGQTLVVEPAQAGTTVACGCGASIKVPSLSRMRELAGQGPYEASTIDVIQGMLGRGALPAGGVCAVSGVSTEDVLELFVEAERIYRSGDNRACAWLGVLVSPIFLFALFRRPGPDVGQERIVSTPLHVAVAYQPKVRRSGQRALKRWLRSVPIYAKLLEEYPRARVEVGAPPSMKPLKSRLDE